MLKIAKMTDYAFVILAELSRTPSGEVRTSRDLAGTIHLPQPAIAKVLKQLQQAGFEQSHRGLHGGYVLNRDPKTVSLVDIITALEGPLSLTACALPNAIDCQTHSTCAVGPHWPHINSAVKDVLAGITLWDISQPRSISRSAPSDPLDLQQA